MTMKTLHLVLKAKWYDMIARGEKKEEYRENTSYWMKRIGKLHDAVCFHKGYTNTTMTFAIEGKSYGYGNPEWGAPKDRKVLKIQLGKRL